MKVLITGGTGLVGKYLANILTNKGYDVIILSRTVSSDMPNGYNWNIEKREVDSIINECDVIIHLAGANIGERRWTSHRRKVIIDSRVKSTELLYENIDKNNMKLKAFISASAVGYYGAVTSSKIFEESNLNEDDFLGNVCKEWERAVDKFGNYGIRVVKFRTGVVLAKDGGVLTKLLLPFKLGMGAALGTGKQYFPWIHISDLCNMYVKAIENTKMNGAYNAVAPEYITNKEFSKSISETIDKPLILPNIPAFILKIIFGKMASLFLVGSRISSKKIEETGYIFQYGRLKNALKSLIR